MDLRREELSAFYGRYLMRCNQHRFEELGQFVADDVNGPGEGLSRYIAGLRAVIEAFADYHWNLQRLLVRHKSAPVAHQHVDILKIQLPDAQL
jgi:predicted ester cyclase